MGAAARMLRQTPDPHWFMKQIDYKVARLGVMTRQSPDKCTKLAGTKICLLSNLIGLTRLRGGALSPIRLLWGCIPTAEKVDLKFIQCGFESHHPYHLYWGVAQSARAGHSKCLGCGFESHLLRHIGESSNGRTTVSKTVYYGFESLLPCQPMKQVLCYWVLVEAHRGLVLTDY